MKTAIIQRTCKYCKKKFKIQKSQLKFGYGIFCSKKCFYENRKKEHRVTRKCQVCGKIFERRLSEVSQDRGKYCSRICTYKGMSSNIIRRCPVCGKQFKARLSEVKRGVRKYCSKKCFDKSRTTKIIKKCKNCRKEFFVQPHRLKNRRGIYCSIRCYRLTKQSEIEKIVRKQLVKRKVKFIRQAKISRYSVDFLLPDRKIILEADGTYWHSTPIQIEKDKIRDKNLMNRGYQIIHISEEDITKPDFQIIDLL